MTVPDLLSVFDERYPAPVAKQELAVIAATLYRREKIGSGRKTALICCSDYSIRKLNRSFRNKDKATDVLSFEFGDTDLLGEIYISLERVRVQANRYGVSIKNEFKRLFIHGLLHLAGYDHIKAADRVVMETREALFADLFT